MRNLLTQKTCLAIAGFAALAAASTQATAADKVTYGTNWLAQAEHGGFYQAVADGTYAKHGLEVTIVQGGPNAANSALLIAGKIDFYMGSPQSEISAVEQGIPIVDVAAIFQKDPQILIAHPDAGIDKLEDLAKLRSDPEILITHAKPGLFHQIEKELLQGAGKRKIKMLMAESVFSF